MAKRSRRKTSINTDYAIKRKKIINLVFEGKTPKEIAQKMKIRDVVRLQNTISYIIKHLPEAKAERLRNQYRKSMYKFSLKKAGEFVLLVKKIIRGEAQLLQKPPSGMVPTLRKRNPKKVQAIISELKNTNKNFVQIAREINSSNRTVARIYYILKASSEQMPERGRGFNNPVQKNEKRITNFFTKKKIDNIMKEQERGIVNKAERMYRTYRNMFNKAGMGEADIAQYIRMELPWKLQTFNPDKKKGKTLKEKITGYCLWNINKLSLNVKRTAERKSNAKISLDKKVGKGETKITLKDLQTKTLLPDADPEKLIKLIETMSKKAGLNYRENAVLYAKAIEINRIKTAEMLGLKDSKISQIAKTLKAKMKKAGYKI